MNSFEEPLQVATLLTDFERPWFVAGGWAIDLYLGHITRIHKDIEIVILRCDQLTLQSYLRDWKFKKVIGRRVEPWSKGEWLELPVHEIHAQRADGNPSALEILLSESSGEKWRFRRNPEILRPLSILGLHSEIGIPFLSPEIVLLFKAKNPTIQDQVDFNNVCEVLGGEQQHWLRQAIKACHPGHPWLEKL